MSGTRIASYLRSAWLVAAILFASSAFSADGAITVLAMEGDGSASVVIDGKVAYLADGGRAGMRGVGGASLGGQTIPAYLESRQVTDVVVSCSHPHDDHMAGLVELIQTNSLRKFNLYFVDNFREINKARPALADIYEATTGQAARYVSAHQRDAFAGLPRGPSVQVRNFAYDPALLGKQDHDMSMIVEYAFSRGGKEKVTVDFDDASQKLIELWADSGRQANIVIVPHHGSKNNQITSLLADRKKYGLTDAILTMNRRNRYGHPDPAGLLDLVKTLGPEHVFLTESESGKNIGIDVRGNISLENRKVAKERLQEYVETRRSLLEGRLQSSMDEIQARAAADEVARINVMTVTPRERLELLAQASGMDERAKSRLVRLLNGVEALSEVESRVAGSTRNPMAMVVASLSGLHARSASTVAAKPPPREPPVQGGTGTDPSNPSGPRPGDAADPGTGPRPPPESPGGNGGVPGGGGGGGGGGGKNDGAKRYFEQSDLAQKDMRARNPSVNNESRSWSRRSAFFNTSMRTSRVRFGGVVVGNRTSGPAPTRMEYLFIPDAELLDKDYGDRGGAYVLRFFLSNGEVADYSGFSNQDLWAAVNFVQPMKALQERIRSMGRTSEELSGSIGLVGIAGHMPFSQVFPRYGGWTFSVHPAIANTSVAMDAMRVDMLLSVVAGGPIRNSPGIPAALRDASWNSIRFDTYQWHDAPIEMRQVGGRLQALPRDGIGQCAMRLRLVDYHRLPSYPAWFDPTEREESVESEARTLVGPAALQGSDAPQVAEERARLWKLIDDLESEKMESRPLDDKLQALCEEFDGLAHIDRFAKLVAVLNWYREQTRGDLPELAFDPRMDSGYVVAASWRFRDVLPSEFPMVSWAALLSNGINYLALVYLLLLLISAVAALVVLKRFAFRNRA